MLLLRLSNEEPWAHLYRKEVASPQSKSWWPKWPWNKNKSKTVMESSFKPVVQTAVDIAAIPTRSIWKGNMTRDGARISGYLTMIGIDLAGAIIALEKAGISLTPLVVTGGVSALAISLSLRNLLGNLFAGVLLMFYDVCRQGEVIRFVPAPGLPSNDLRILTITLKHTVLVNAEEEATADFLILPNTGVYVCGITKVLFYLHLQLCYHPYMSKTRKRLLNEWKICRRT